MSQPQSQFVSNIPNNTLEPVFLGGGSGPSSKSSGAYVPAFLRDKTNSEGEKKQVHTKDFTLETENFPTLSGSSKAPATKTTFSYYSDALKKPKLDNGTPPAVVKHTNIYQEKAQKKRKAKMANRVLDEYSDSDSDDNNYLPVSMYD